MKLRGEILRAESMGDRLELQLQMQTLPTVDWYPWLKVQLQINDTSKSRVTYHVGRVVEITVKPK